MVGWWVGGRSQGPPPTWPHLALPAPGTAGITIFHPHAPEGVVGDFPLVPDAGEEQSVRLGWGVTPQGTHSHLPFCSSPQDPTVGIPAEGLLMLGHIVEGAELVLVPGGYDCRQRCPILHPYHPSPDSRGLHQAEALARKSEEMCGP